MVSGVGGKEEKRENKPYFGFREEYYSDG